jgi:hypothetical protein
MTTTEQGLFRRQYKSIVYQVGLVAESNKHLRALHSWDKNGSHTKAILASLERKKDRQNTLKKMLNGASYEEWSAISKRLSVLQHRLFQTEARKIKTENEINDLKFPELQGMETTTEK